MSTTKLLETIVESIGRGSFNTDVLCKLLDIFESNEVVTISPEEIDTNCGFILRCKIGFKVSDGKLIHYRFNDDGSFDLLSEEDVTINDLEVLETKMYDAMNSIKFRTFRSALVDIIRCAE